jgi:excisionase family DNA binding protein
MGKTNKFDGDWYLRLASKRDRSTPTLNAIAEQNMRDLDAKMAQDREVRRQRRLERQLRPVDLSERFTIAEVAERLKVKPSTIYDWISQGEIEAESHGPKGRLKRISQRALEDYLRKR